MRRCGQKVEKIIERHYCGDQKSPSKNFPHRPIVHDYLFASLTKHQESATKRFYFVGRWFHNAYFDGLELSNSRCYCYGLSNLMIEVESSTGPKRM